MRKGKGKRMPDWYCKLFICSEMSEKELLDLINLHLHGIKQGIRTIRTGLLELDLTRNDEYMQGSQDFLFWRYYADLETVTEERAAYVCCIRKLMAFLRERQIETVAACDFEQELKQ